MKYLFWNTFKNPEINTFLEPLIREQECDVVLLAEYTDNVIDLLKNLSKNDYSLYLIPPIACFRITTLSIFKPGNVKPINSRTHFTIMQMPHKTLGFHLLVGVHFPSKLHGNDHLTFIAESIDLKQCIEEAENLIGNNKTVIVGDFNMNPFEEPMVGALALHSIPTQEEAKRGNRIINKRQYSMFYNPMWNLFGDKNMPAGTYYYSKSGHVTYFWNMFDQVIIRPSLFDNFDIDSLKIIDKVNGTPLVNTNGRPKQQISDHLPIVFEIT